MLAVIGNIAFGGSVHAPRYLMLAVTGNIAFGGSIHTPAVRYLRGELQ